MTKTQTQFAKILFIFSSIGILSILGYKMFYAPETVEKECKKKLTFDLVRHYDNFTDTIHYVEIGKCNMWINTSSFHGTNYLYLHDGGYVEHSLCSTTAFLRIINYKEELITD